MTTEEILEETEDKLVSEGFEANETERIREILLGNLSNIRSDLEKFLSDKHGIDF